MRTCTRPNGHIFRQDASGRQCPPIEVGVWTHRTDLEVASKPGSGHLYANISSGHLYANASSGHPYPRTGLVLAA